MIEINDIIMATAPEHQDFVKVSHDALVEAGYKFKFESKSNGPFASYSNPKTKRSIFNLLFRKNGLIVRLYPAAINNNILNELPDTMIKEIDKSIACKRLIDPTTCNPKCITGYDFTIRDKRYQKCRYMCFQFAVTKESKPIITKWLNSEIKG